MWNEWSERPIESVDRWVCDVGIYVDWDIEGKMNDGLKERRIRGKMLEILD
jgi:hypothetical protein